MKAPAWFLIGCLLASVSTHALPVDQPPDPHRNEVILINTDRELVGLNDQTVAAPVGGNFGVTVGEQRRIAYQFAMDLWAAVLRSPVGIHVVASFGPQICNKDSGVLGVNSGLKAFETTRGLAGIEYPPPLANAIEGGDLDPEKPEIKTQFNSSLGSKNADGTDCLTDYRWYFGLDGKTPPGGVNFIDTVMHEVAHGLGFGGNVYSTKDIYSQFVYDNRRHKAWKDTDRKVRSIARTNQKLVFHGPHVQAEVPLVLGPKMIVRLSGIVQRDIARYGTAAFGPAILPGAFAGPLAIVNDAAGGDPMDACEPLLAGSLTGRVAFVNRSTCDYELQARHVQDAGAIALIVGNADVPDKPDKYPEEPGYMHASGDLLSKATIPAVRLSLNDANFVRTAPAGNITAQTISIINQYQGADENNYPHLYAPDIFAAGSSYDHFDTLASPNLVMEPSITDDAAAHVHLDLTPALLADEGWVLNPGNGMIGTCDTGVRAVVPGGKIVGANIQAYSGACVTAANGSRSKYLRCMTDHASELKNAKLIDNAQFAQIRSCAARVQPIAQH